MCNCSNNRQVFNKPSKSSLPKSINNSNIQLSNIWKRILNNDGFAKQELVNLYLIKYPNNRRLTLDLTIQNLHNLYLKLIN